MKFNHFSRYNVFVCLIIAMLFATIAGAEPFSVTQDAIVDSIFADERASFELVISNQGNMTERYVIYSSDPRFITAVEPSEILVDGRSSKTFIITVYPTSSFNTPGTYGIPIVIRSVQTNKDVRDTLTIGIKSENFREFSPSLVLDARINNNERVDPRTPFPVSIRITNKNRLDVRDLVVNYQSALCQGSFSADIPPLGEFQNEVFCTLDRHTPPQTDMFRISLSYDGRSLAGSQTYEYRVMEITEFFSVDKNTTEFFLKSTLSLNATNKANVHQVQVFSVQRNAFEKLFTKLSTTRNVDVASTSSGYEFTISLSPEETAGFVVQTNTRGFFITLFVIVLAAVIVYALYYALRSPVVVKREITILSKKDGGASHAKVLLNVRNRTGQVLDKLRVIETVPSLVEIEKAFDVGTLKPTKIVRHEKKGTLIRWDFTTLEPFEERIITYRIQSKLSIIGRLDLPPTTVKFSADGGKSQRTVRFEGDEKGSGLSDD